MKTVYTNTNSKSKYIPIAIVIIVYYLLILIYSVDYPAGDDYDLFLDFLYKYNKADNLGDKTALLFSQHNEHRLVFSRIVFLMYYSVFKTPNFIFPVFLANLSVLALFIIFAYTISKENLVPASQKYSYLFIISCFLFQYGLVDNMLRAAISTSSLTLVLFALMTIILLCSENRTMFSLGLAMSFLTVYTNGNGIAVFLPCLIYLIACKRAIRILILLTTFFILFWLYFSGYSTPSQHPSPFNLSYIMENLIRIFLFVIGFLGSSFGIKSVNYPIITTISYVPSAFVGLCILIFMGYLTYKKYYLKNNCYYWFSVFILLSGISCAITRVGFGIGQALTLRYRIYSVSIILSLVLVLLQILKKRNISISPLILKRLSMLSILYLASTIPFFIYFILAVQPHSFEKGKSMHYDKHHTLPVQSLY